MTEAPAPRYAPTRPLPRYAYVPGSGTPHPRRHPAGHSHGRPEPAVVPLDPDDPGRNLDFLAAIDQYNAGFYWECHELIEALWHAAGRSGPVAELLRGLVKLAAAGVKLRQRNPEGVRKHAVRAAEHFARLRAQTGAAVWARLDLEALQSAAVGLAERVHLGLDELELPAWRLLD